jgi:hypothetical protein
MLSTIHGYKTYLVMAALLLVVLLEKGLGLDVSGVALGDDWMLVVMNAIGLGASLGARELALARGAVNYGGKWCGWRGPEGRVAALRRVAAGRAAGCLIRRGV